MVIDKREYQERIEILFSTVGQLDDFEIRELINDIRIVVEQRSKTRDLTIIRL